MWFSADAFRPARFSLETAEPELEPVSAAFVASHLVLTEADDLELLESFIKQARGLAETRMRRRIMDQAAVLRLPDFPRHGELLELPHGCPVRSVVVGYVDAAGAEVVLPGAAYEVIQSDGAQPYLVPAPGLDWPATGPGHFTVTISFRCGWATVGEVPEQIRGAIARLAHDLYETRNAAVDRPLVELPWFSAQLTQWSLPRFL